jgi:Tol biopolymer transport system component
VVTTRAKLRASVALALASGGLALVLPAGAQAAFPGGNGRVAFASYSSSSEGFSESDPRTVVRSIDVVAPNGSGRRSLRACRRVGLVEDGDLVPVAPDRGDCSIEYNSPAWSPDGKRLAFDAGARLALMRSDGSGFRLLAQQTANDGEPAWSPNGRRLVFSGARTPDPDAGTALYVLGLESGRVRRLTFRGGRDHSPAWSSRGRIAFTRGGEAFRPGSGNIFTVRPDSRALRQLTYRNGSDPAWSPHASKLIFVRGRQRARGRGWGYSLFTVRAAGSGLRRVNTPGADAPNQPSWSPDGKRIAYHGFDEPASCVSAQRLDGSELRKLAECGLGSQGAMGGFSTDWQPLPRR